MSASAQASGATAAVLAVACLLVPGWVYVGYPALLMLLARLAPRPVRRGPFTGRVTVIVPAHDEERVIAEKVRNAWDVAPRGADCEVLVVSDGSTDGTVRQVTALQAALPGTRVLDLPRVGKAAALNAAVEGTHGDVLVFTDANALLAPGSLDALLAPFADPEVGGVAGNQVYRRRRKGEAGTGEGETAYWAYDTRLKILESTIASCYAADGSLHALRRECHVPIGDRAQADDMALSMRVVTGGRRLVLAEDAVAHEDEPASGRAEFARKVRVTNHSLRSLLLLGPALWTSGWYTVVLLSHKVLRHLGGLFLLAALVLTLAGAPWSGACRVLLVPQAVMVVAGLAGHALRASRLGRVRVLAVPYYFWLANLAAAVGCVQVFFGRRIVGWRPQRGDA